MRSISFEDWEGRYANTTSSSARRGCYHNVANRLKGLYLNGHLLAIEHLNFLNISIQSCSKLRKASAWIIKRWTRRYGPRKGKRAHSVHSALDGEDTRPFVHNSGNAIGSKESMNRVTVQRSPIANNIWIASSSGEQAYDTFRIKSSYTDNTSTHANPRH